MSIKRAEDPFNIPRENIYIDLNRAREGMGCPIVLFLVRGAPEASPRLLGVPGEALGDARDVLECCTF